MTVRTVAIVQARMNSTRLPGKVLKQVCGRPFLSILLERVAAAKTLDEIVVATTGRVEDKAIVDACRRWGVPIFCGSEKDVLLRYRDAARAFHAKTVVRLTADCPLLDPTVIDDVVHVYHAHSVYDYVSNVQTRLFPRGLDTEVFSFEALEKAAREAKHPSYREHVTPYFYLPGTPFQVGELRGPYDASKFRWTLDQKEDLQLLTQILEVIYPTQILASWEEIVSLYETHPEWKKWNSHVRQKELFMS